MDQTDFLSDDLLPNPKVNQKWIHKFWGPCPWCPDFKYLSNDSAVKVPYYTVIVVVNVVIYDGLENTILDILVNNWFINNLNR